MHEDVYNGWKKGPLPPNTYYWGGVVREDRDPDHGFEFADFRGDHVLLPMSGNKRLEANEVAYYNNSLIFPVTTNPDPKAEFKGE